MLNRRSILQLIGSVSVIAGAGVGVGPAHPVTALRTSATRKMRLTIRLMREADMVVFLGWRSESQCVMSSA